MFELIFIIHTEWDKKCWSGSCHFCRYSGRLQMYSW